MKTEKAEVVVKPYIYDTVKELVKMQDELEFFIDANTNVDDTENTKFASLQTAIDNIQTAIIAFLSDTKVDVNTFCKHLKDELKQAENDELNAYFANK